MNTKTLTLVATIGVIAVLAIGIGYAYTATVNVSDNDVGATFITVTPEDETGSTTTSAAFNGSLSDYNIIYDTVTKYDGGLKYEYALNTTDSTATKSYYKNENNELIITAVNNADKPTGSHTIYYIGTQTVELNSSNGVVPDFTFTVKKTAGTIGANYNLFIGFNANANTVNNKIVLLTNGVSPATFNAAGGDTSTSALKYVVDLYAQFPEGSTTDVPDKDIMKDVVFEYKATVEISKKYTYYSWNTTGTPTYVEGTQQNATASSITLSNNTDEGFVGWKVLTSAPSPLTTKLTGTVGTDGVLAAGSVYYFTQSVPILIIPVYQAQSNS